MGAYVVFGFKLAAQAADFLTAGGLVLVDEVLERFAFGVGSAETVLEGVALGVVLGELGLGGVEGALDLLLVHLSCVGIRERLLLDWGTWAEEKWGGAWGRGPAGVVGLA